MERLLKIVASPQYSSALVDSCYDELLANFDALCSAYDHDDKDKDKDRLTFICLIIRRCLLSEYFTIRMKGAKFLCKILEKHDDEFFNFQSSLSISTNIINNYERINRCKIKFYESIKKIEKNSEVKNAENNNGQEDIEKQSHLNKLFGIENLFEARQDEIEGNQDIKDNSPLDLSLNNFCSTTTGPLGDVEESLENKIEKIIEYLNNAIDNICAVNSGNSKFDALEIKNSITIFLSYGMFGSDWIIRQSVSSVYLNILQSSNFVKSPLAPNLKCFSKLHSSVIEWSSLFLYLICNDFFADFHSLHFNAPIREVCNAVLLAALEESSNICLWETIITFFNQMLLSVSSKWQNQHSALCFFKSLLLVLEENVEKQKLLPDINILQNIAKLSETIIFDANLKMDDDVINLIISVMATHNLKLLDYLQLDHAEIIEKLCLRLINDQIGVCYEAISGFIIKLIVNHEVLSNIPVKYVSIIVENLLSENIDISRSSLNLIECLCQTSMLEEDLYCKIVMNCFILIIISQEINEDQIKNIFSNIANKDDLNLGTLKCLILDIIDLSSAVSSEDLILISPFLNSKDFRKIIAEYQFKFSCQEIRNSGLSFSNRRLLASLIYILIRKVNIQFKIDTIFTYYVNSKCAFQNITGILLLLCIENQSEILEITKDLKDSMRSLIAAKIISVEQIHSFAKIEMFFKELISLAKLELGESNNNAWSIGEIEDFWEKNRKLLFDDPLSEIARKSNVLLHSIEAYKTLEKKILINLKSCQVFALIHSNIPIDSNNLILKPLLDVFKFSKETSLVNLTSQYLIKFIDQNCQNNQSLSLKIMKSIIEIYKKACAVYLSESSENNSLDSAAQNNFIDYHSYLMDPYIVSLKKILSSCINEELLINLKNIYPTPSLVQLLILEIEISLFTPVNNYQKLVFEAETLIQRTFYGEDDKLKNCEIFLNSINHQIIESTLNNEMPILHLANFFINKYKSMKKYIDSDNIDLLQQIIIEIDNILKHDNCKISQFAPIFFPDIFRLLTHYNNSIRRSASHLADMMLNFIISSISTNKIYETKNDKDFPEDVMQLLNSGLEFVKELQFNTDRGDQDLDELLGEVDFKLRSYQIKGILWLRFLAKNFMNGILADDMGLGKTIQTLCAIFLCHKTEIHPNNKHTSLIVCPMTLVRHWSNEIETFFGQFNFKVLSLYLPDCKYNITIDSYDIIITSYSFIKSYPDVLKETYFTYIVLDEGHLIKNPALKLTENISQLRGKHKLLLTGTPIQNSLWEIYSLFNFIMPGYLGKLSDFRSKYVKPITAIRSKIKHAHLENEAEDNSSKILQGLKQFTSPFILRRTKESVLKDLPEKIVQDYFCDMSELQKPLYDIISKSEKFVDIKEDSVSDTAEKDGSYLSRMNLLRKICNHPALVKDHSKATSKIFSDFISKHNVEQWDINLSGKIAALVALVKSYEGEFSESNLDDKNEHSGPPMKDEASGLPDPNFGIISKLLSDRFIIFYQLISSKQILMKCLDQNFPTHQYISIDGDTPVQERVGIANQ
ncbi:MAG: TATA-binding protein-associated factor mot1, variant 2 [Marteilia pararefringens]